MKAFGIELPGLGVMSNQNKLSRILKQ